MNLRTLRFDFAALHGLSQNICKDSLLLRKTLFDLHRRHYFSHFHYIISLSFANAAVLLSARHSSFWARQDQLNIDTADERRDFDGLFQCNGHLQRMPLGSNSSWRRRNRNTTGISLSNPKMFRLLTADVSEVHSSLRHRTPRRFGIYAPSKSWGQSSLPDATAI